MPLPFFSSSPPFPFHDEEEGELFSDMPLLSLSLSLPWEGGEQENHWKRTKGGYVYRRFGLFRSYTYNTRCGFLGGGSRMREWRRAAGGALRAGWCRIHSLL